MNREALETSSLQQKISVEFNVIKGGGDNFFW